MGIVVYTLVTVFLWPRTNAGGDQEGRRADGRAGGVLSRRLRYRLGYEDRPGQTG